MSTFEPTGGLIDDGAAYRVARFRNAFLATRVWVSWALIAANVVVFAAMVARGVHPMDPTIESLLVWGADYGPRTTGGEWWRLGSAMFLHIGLIHLGMNMLVLYQVGPFVERLYGNVGFLLAYLLSGLLASVASVALNPHVVSAGASGAVFGAYGLLVAYLVRCKGSIPGNISSTLLRSSGSFVGINLLYGFSRSGIDMAAHVGGLAAGFVLGLALALPLEEAGRRGGRNLIVGLGGLVIFVLGCAALPRSIDMQAEYAKLSDLETRVLAKYNGAIEKKVGDDEFARMLETDVLPDWRAFHTRLDGWPLRGAEDQRRVRLSRYMADRQTGWEMMIEGIRSHDQAKVKAGVAKVKQAGEKSAGAGG